MGEVASFMPQTRPEQRMWRYYIDSLEEVIYTANAFRNEWDIDISRKFLKVLDDINEMFLETGYCYSTRNDRNDRDGEVTSVLNKIVEDHLHQYSGPEITREEAEILYKKTVWNLIQDIKRPFKKLIRGDHIFKEEAKEFANFLDYAKRHCVSYSEKMID